MVIKPTRIDAKIKGDALADFKGFLFEALASLHNSNRTMVTTKLSAWDKVYRGLPKESTRSFPWENASNIIVQIVGQHTDTLTARILGSLYEVDPLWALIACGAYDASDKIEAKREALEQFLQLNALDPDALDLYRVEQLWFCDAIKYGFKVVKASFESNFEQQITDGEELRIPVSDGPRIENVNYEDFLCGSSFKTIEDAPFKAERLYLTRQDIEERRYTKKFDSYAVDKLLLTTPDDNGTTRIQREADTEKGISTLGTTKAFDRWHVYECWCKYFLNGKMYSTVSYVHLASKNFLGGFFNYLPQNKEPYVSARLGYRSSDLYGQGFCELLGNAQEEASAMHNRRNDNATIANLRMFRISPKATNLGTNIKLQPFSILRAGKDEIESLQLGDVYNSTFEEEQLLLQETANRSGTTPAVAGSGGGSPTRKTGAYSSQGTFALMTDGNRRVNLDTMDMRYAHMKVGKLILELHSYFGVPSRQLLGFGEQGDLIKDALEKCKEGRLRISVKAATASMNKELDRQNDVFLSQIFNRHFMSMGQLLQSVLAPATPPPIKEYLVRVISASDTLMGKIAKSFNLENVSSFVPKPAVIQQLEDQENKMKQLKKQAQEAQNANSEYSGIAPIESSNGISFGEKQSVQDAYGVPGDDGEAGDNGADADSAGE